MVVYTSDSSQGPTWVSDKTVRLLKPINGMAWGTPLYRCSATLFITPRADSMNSAGFFSSSFYTFGARKQRFVEGWMISTCDLCPFLMFTGRTRTQLNWGEIKQTHQTSRLLQCQSSCRKTLIKHVGSQTR